MKFHSEQKLIKMIYILGFTFYFLLAMKVKTKSPNMNGGYSEAGI